MVVAAAVRDQQEVARQRTLKAIAKVTLEPITVVLVEREPQPMIRRQTQPEHAAVLGGKLVAPVQQQAPLELLLAVLPHKAVAAREAQRGRQLTSALAHRIRSTTPEQRTGRHRDACVGLFWISRSCILWGLFDGARKRARNHGVAK